MILFPKIRGFLVNISLVVLLTTTIAFSFSSASWAAISVAKLTNQAHGSIAAVDLPETIKDKAQEVMGNLTGDSETPADKQASEFKAKTLEGINNGIKNPNYQPGGRTKQATKIDREATTDLKSEVRDNFDKFENNG